MAMVKQIAYCFLLVLALWLAGLFWFLAEIPSTPSDDDTPSDAIVVLTGGSHRLEYALKLLAEGKGKVLFISGVAEGITTDMILKQVPADTVTAIHAKGTPIVLGHHAENTIGNALETARWLKQKHYASIRLVTANYHMLRSISEFTEIMPDTTIIPEPVIPEEFIPGEWWKHEESIQLLISEYTKYVAGQLRHGMVSAIGRL